MTEVASDKIRPNRNGRQRQKTRGRLIDAALLVMAQKGADAATINDITETADLGFGSFYNYFSSKDEILSAATDVLFERIGDRIDVTISAIDDPVQALAVALRLFVNIIIHKPEWAKFIVRVSMVPGYKRVGLFPRLFRDIHRVEKSGRLLIMDSGTATYAVGGAMLFLVTALLEGDLPEEGAPERISGVALRILGVPEAEITQLVNCPLPVMEMDGD